MWKGLEVVNTGCDPAELTVNKQYKISRDLEQFGFQLEHDPALVIENQLLVFNQASSSHSKSIMHLPSIILLGLALVFPTLAESANKVRPIGPLLSSSLTPSLATQALRPPKTPQVLPERSLHQACTQRPMQ